MDLVADLTLVLLCALAGGFLAQRFGQPLMVGYILAGVLVGPFTGGLTLVHLHNIEQFAELGVALLLFSIGLELSFRELASVRAVALGGATVQILLTIGLGFWLARALGMGWQPAVWFGALVSLSSTMVALKTIQAQGRLGTLSSRVMLGILTVQDLAVVPLMIVLPELSRPEAGFAPLFTAGLRAAVLLGLIVFVSTRLVPRLLSFVARWNSRELFLLATTTVALGVGYITWWVGLSLALGAFLAGLVISDSEYAHQALSDVVPLRDLFGMLFFVSVGLLLDPMLAWHQAGALAIVVSAILVGKPLILGGVVRAFGYRNVIPLATGLTLFQVGEFAFVLARVGRSTGAITNDLYSLVLNTAIVTMVLTPAVSGLTPRLYRRFGRQRASDTPEMLNIPRAGLSDHVIVAGAGRVGSSIAHALAHLQLPFLLVEADDRRVQQARLAGFPIIYGDASQRVVLEAAAIARARALLVTVSTFADVRAIVRTVQQLRPDLPIVARAEGSEVVSALYELGIQEVTSPEFEAAIEMTRQALIHFNIPAHEVLQVASAIRRERYRLTTDEGGGSGLELMSQIGEVARQLDFTWLGLPADSALNGRTLGALRVREAIGASVVGVIHGGVLIANPDGSFRLEAGDLIAVLGTREQISRFEDAARGPGRADRAEPKRAERS
jgi:CPA2 family monovalent cation:H+ antiporter-2